MYLSSGISLIIILLCVSSGDCFHNDGSRSSEAAIIWRRMLEMDPFLAADSSMYWRLMSVEDPKQAAAGALEARKLTAINPGKLYKEAAILRSKRGISSQYESMTKLYWRKFAANDPEVAVRSAMYWRGNAEANMYW